MMGQYFKGVNIDKKEFVCPWCLGGGAKLWEWAANPPGAVFTLLLRKSSAGGGGDYYGYSTQNIELDTRSPERAHRSLMDAFQSVAGIEGKPISPPDDSIVGRWAGDRVVLIGDYDSSKLWDELHEYRNISEKLVTEWNRFIELPEMRLKFNPLCGCRKREEG